MPLFLLVIFATLFGLDLVGVLASSALLARAHASAVAHWGIALFFLLQALGLAALIAGRAVGRQPGEGMGRPLLSLVMIWHLLLALPQTAISLLWLAASAWSAPEARTALVGLLILPALSILATAISLRQLDGFRIRKLTLPIPGLPAALEGFTIAHLSDLHVGKLTRGPVLDRIVEETNRLGADLAVVTGDLINMSLEDLPRALEVLRGIKARHGLFACEGNHDLIEDGARFEAEARASGIPFLFDEAVTLSVDGEPLRIVGLRWVGEARRLLAEPTSGFTLLLAHNPVLFDAAAEAGVPLTLAGHTHGGQIMLTERIGFGPWFFRYWGGLYRKGMSQMVVSNGTGNWFPLRINVPAEIVHLTLVRE